MWHGCPIILIIFSCRNFRYLMNTYMSKILMTCFIILLTKKISGKFFDELQMLSSKFSFLNFSTKLFFVYFRNHEKDGNTYLLSLCIHAGTYIKIIGYYGSSEWCHYHKQIYKSIDTSLQLVTHHVHWINKLLSDSKACQDIKHSPRTFQDMHSIPS